MTTYVRAPEAARQLGVSTATLYSYVSRGRVTRKLGADGRSSLFDLAELERLREQNRRPQPPPPTIDVRIASSVTQLNEDGLRFRDTPVEDLVDLPFEQVCGLLWRRPDVRLAPVECDRITPAESTDDRPASSPMMDLVSLVASLDLPDDPFDAAARVLGAIPVALGGRADPTLGYAARLTAAWVQDPAPEVTAAINTTLVVLADHELATSTLAVRVAASVRSSPAAAMIAGLATLDGDLHGSASHHVHRLLDDCRVEGVDQVLDRHRTEHRRVPGFGHTIYRRHDPRFDLLLDRVARLPDPLDRLRVVSELRTRAGSYIAQPPNVDLALGALTYVMDLPPGCPLFAIARLAGFAAHYREELDERPVRYRGLSY
ncbi:citrate/2-methylcitrate synthase [Ilumatobacter nonamiensis]|uniref:citrate/2-methylcitrate synthase n=1 Tax=Ilumatobacter nonamiensis TaxID=467093 RepID=UPI0003472138|nr:citrate/2-methylcitrate synthase [Ilumatobacter nonamiensis]